MDGSEWLDSRFDPLDVRLDATHRQTGGTGEKKTPCLGGE
jgi:hypothetical protein